MYEALSIALLETITRFYLRSNRFTGIPVATLADRQGTKLEAVRRALRPLVQAQLVSLEFGDRYPDPHVRALHDAPIWHQQEGLDEGAIELACAFPAQRHLERVVNVRHFIGQPYTLRLALGAPRLKIETFHPSVLALYDLEPSPTSAVEQRAPARRRPPAYGMAYDTSLHRAVATCVGDLAELPSADQQLWQGKSIHGPFRIHPEFERSLYGHSFNRRLSIYRALQEEMQTINRCCAYLRRPLLFPCALADGLFLNEVGMLARPSVATASRFLTRLQTLTIQNLDTAFFDNDDVETRAVVGAFEREVTQATTTLERLDNWLIRYHGATGPSFRPYLKALGSTRRRIRRIQLSSLGEGWEDTMSDLQRRVVRAAYASFRDVRKHFEHRIGADLYMHPAARDERVWSL